MILNLIIILQIIFPTNLNTFYLGIFMVKYISNINKTTHETHHITMTLLEMTLSVSMTLLKMILSVTSGSHLMIILRPLILII